MWAKPTITYVSVAINPVCRGWQISRRSSACTPYLNGVIGVHKAILACTWRAPGVHFICTYRACTSVTSNIILHGVLSKLFILKLVFCEAGNQDQNKSLIRKKPIFDLNRRARPLVIQEIFQGWRATPHFWRDDRRAGKKLPRARDIVYKLGGPHY